MFSPDRLRHCTVLARDQLLSERNDHGHWRGELSNSALATAVAVLALDLVRRSGTLPDRESELSALVTGGLTWLANHPNADGGWGDTVLSRSNISTTMLAHASFHGCGAVEQFSEVAARSRAFIDDGGGVPAIVARYGKDKTFSVPILTHCALAGTVSWDKVKPLPFELAALPHRFYSTVRLPVVSYALPALIAIGQVRHHHRPPRNPLVRTVRNAARERTLDRLIRLQPDGGGFLEAIPLTAFVTMSLAGMKRADHPVARSGVDFLVRSVRPDGSWPIDTDLATWTTTLAINAIPDAFNTTDRERLTDWIVNQQYRQVHPFTNAAPGGWAWTDLPGGVPDADDTPGAILALLNLHRDGSPPKPVIDAARHGIGWLLDLQNRDGGWPTFCRGWGTLPFDRSSADLTAHTLRALNRVRSHPAIDLDQRTAKRTERATTWGFRFLEKRQRTDGSWLPLWFGNQEAPDDINPVYGTTRVLFAYRDLNRLGDRSATEGFRFLRQNQNDDGGWGGLRGCASSIEETSLAVESLAADDPLGSDVERGLGWLCDRVDELTAGDTLTPPPPSPIGFYFAKLWYYERLYPLIFLTSTLHRLHRELSRMA